MERTIRTLLFTLVAFCSMVVMVQASGVVIEFTTTAYVQNDTYGDLEGIIEYGSEVRGRIVYDTEEPYPPYWYNSTLNTRLKKYRAVSFTIEIGESFAWSGYSSTGHGIEIQDNRTVGSQTFDKFVMMESGEAQLTDKIIGGYASVWWRDLTCVSFNSTDLPTAEELNNFAVENDHFSIRSQPGKRWRINGMGPVIWTITGDVTAVPLDIKPGSCTNPLNVKSRGILPVAILGTEDFDVNEIDIATIRLADVSPIRSALEDMGAPPDDYDCEDLQPDGFDDLILKFKTQEIVEVLGEVEDGDEFILTLTGSLKSNELIKGEDVVLILKKGKK